MYSQIDGNKRKTWFLIVLFTMVIIALGWVLGEYAGAGSMGIIIAVMITTIMNLVAFYKGDKVALASSGAKEIQKTKKYTVTTKKGMKTLEVKNAQTVLEVFHKFRPSFYYYLCRFLDRDLRNAVAHEEYNVNIDEITYKNKFIKKEIFLLNLH